MCKLMMMAGINESNRTEAWELIREMAGIMSEKMTDGIGYAAVTEDGELFGERWHKSEEAFDLKEEADDVSAIERGLIQSFEGALTLQEKPKRYNSFGDHIKTIEELTDKTCAITLHGRYATSSKDFKNTHPFVLNETSLIHNGVIRNAFQIGKMTQSTCDSEVILNLYDEMQVSRFPSNIQGVIDELRGYFACGIFTKDSNDARILDIFKDDTANLFAAYIEDLSLLVYVTNVADLDAACELVGVSVSSVFKVEGGNLIRINPVTGVVISVTKFDYTKAGASSYTTWAELKRKTLNSQQDEWVGNIDNVLGL